MVNEFLKEKSLTVPPPIHVPCIVIGKLKLVNKFRVRTTYVNKLIKKKRPFKSRFKGIGVLFLNSYFVLQKLDLIYVKDIETALNAKVTEPGNIMRKKTTFKTSLA